MQIRAIYHFTTADNLHMIAYAVIQFSSKMEKEMNKSSGSVC